MADAERCVELAQVTLGEAQSDLQAKVTELSALEAELPGAEKALGAGNSIEELTAALNHIMKDMQSGGCVPQHIMSETLGHMSLLMTGVSKIAEEIRRNQTTAVAAAASSTSDQEAPGCKRGRVEDMVNLLTQPSKSLDLPPLPMSPLKTDSMDTDDDNTKSGKCSAPGALGEQKM